MKRIALLLAALLWGAALLSCAQSKEEGLAVNSPAQEVKPAQLEALAFDDNTGKERLQEENPLDAAYLGALVEFSAKLAALTLPGQEGNTCLSPLSLHMALSMVTEGARGGTRAELINALCLSELPAEELPRQAGNLMRRLYRENETGMIALANSIWKQEGLPFEQAFSDRLGADYYASLFSVDFADRAVGELIGEWIAENTGGLLSPALNLDPLTVMALVNTLYLSDRWVSPFYESGTAKSDFFGAGGEVLHCDFMNKTESFGAYLRGEGFTAAPLALRNGGRMLFILPDEGLSPNDLPGDEKTLREILDASSYGSGRVIWQVPKFSFGSAPAVADAAKALGVQKAFTEEADFGGILDDTLWISDIVQETYVGIDENGVRAAAYTLIAMAGTGLPPEEEPVRMVLDRPFLFVIVSEEDVPLFIGVVNDPTAG